jgi:hypothetical protein
MFRPDIVAEFDKLSDDMILTPQETQAVVPISHRNLRRGTVLPKTYYSPHRFGFRVGHIRALVRGTLGSVLDAG